MEIPHCNQSTVGFGTWEAILTGLEAGCRSNAERSPQMERTG